MFDNGLEVANHEVIAKGLVVAFFFAHARCTRERGINKNTTGLIRRYYPNKTKVKVVTDEQVVWVVARLYQGAGKPNVDHPMNYLSGQELICSLPKLIALIS